MDTIQLTQDDVQRILGETFAKARVSGGYEVQQHLLDLYRELAEDILPIQLTLLARVIEITETLDIESLFAPPTA